MASNLYIDTTDYDLKTSEGNLVIISDNDYLAQKIESRLRQVRGEWFLNFQLGIPYFEDIFKKNPDLNLVRALLLKTVRETEGVSQVLKFEVGFDNANRTFSVDFEVLGIDGENPITRSVTI